MKKQFFLSVALITVCAALYTSCKVDSKKPAIHRRLPSDARFENVEDASFSNEVHIAPRVSSFFRIESEADSVVNNRENDTSAFNYAAKVQKDVSYSSNYTMKTYTITARPQNESMGTVRLLTDGMEVVGDVYHGAQMEAKVTSVARGYEFVGWMSEGKMLSTAYEFHFIANHEGELIAVFRPFSMRAVDLGLSVRWANANLGADMPSSFGDYYAWGETKAFGEEDYSNQMNFNYNRPATHVKTFYSWLTYKYCDGLEPIMTKYCSDHDYGIVDDKAELEPEDDVAHLHLRRDWHIPTYGEMKELVMRCVWVWTDINGTKGFQVFGPNGNSIFLPAAGCRGYSSRRSIDNGYYWTSLVDDSYQCNAHCLYFHSGNVSNYYLGRYLGQSIRPVRK